jgi:ubiquitin C-terminal hydrolase
MAVYNIEHLKQIFYFFINYLQIRLDHLDSMPSFEIGALLKIVDSSFPFYLNINNNNNLPTEFYEEFFRDLFNFNDPAITSEAKILNQNFKLNNNVNIIYHYMLVFLLNSNFFKYMAAHLNSPMISFERFQYVLGYLCRIIYSYEILDPSIPKSLIKSICDFYKNLFDSGSYKELNKNLLEQFFGNNMWMDYNLLCPIWNIEGTYCDEETQKLCDELLNKDLTLSYFLIQSQKLESRVLGMKSLTNTINTILVNEKMEEANQNIQNIQNNQNNQNNTNNNNLLPFLGHYTKLKKNHVLAFLEKIEIFKIIFGENIHEAILKQSSTILKFLYINDKLTFDQIDYLWKTAGDKHEAISASILNIFSDVISYFSIDHAMHILKIINETPFKEVNDVTIKILDSFSNNKNLTIIKGDKEININNINTQQNISDSQSGVININTANIVNLIPHNSNEMMNFKNQENLENFDFLLSAGLHNDTKNLNDFKSFYLKILWKFSSENSFYSGLTPQVITRARKVLAEILLKPAFKNELAKYVKKCIAGINFNHILSTNLTILDLIFKNMKSLFPGPHNINSDFVNNLKSTFNNDIQDFKSFLEYLEKQYSLTSTILHAVINLKKEVMVIAGEVISLQDNILSTGGMNTSISYSDIMTNYDIKFSESSDKIQTLSKMMHEDNKEIELDDMGNNLSMNTHSINLISNNGNNLLNENEHSPNANQLTSNINDLAFNSHARNLDETLSTEKSLDNSISTISTDISSIEKSRIQMVKDFIENNIDYYQHHNTSLRDHYEVIFRKLKLNYSNNNYYTIVNSLLEFLKYIVFHSNIQITQTQIEYLFTLLVENSVDEEEMNLFYSFFAEVFRYQQMSGGHYISEENFSFILFDILLKLDLGTLPYSAFNLFKQIFYFINATHSNLTLLGGNILDVKDFENLVGFETLWRFYIESNLTSVSSDAQKMLVTIISSLAKKDDENCRNSFIAIFEKIFLNLNQFYYELNQSISGANPVNESQIVDKTNKLISLLFIVNSTKQKLDKPSSVPVTLNIQNFYNGADGKKTPLNLNSETTVKELKQAIIYKIILGKDDSNPNINMNINQVNSNSRSLIEESTLMLLSKGRILKNDRLTLRDLKLENNALIMVHKGGEADTAINIDISEEKINELVMNLKFMLENIEDEVIKRALKKNSYSPDDTVVYLLDETNIMSIRQEIQEENSMPTIDVETKFNYELFNEDKLKLLIDFLDLHNSTLNKNIWQLLSALKFPEKVLMSLTEPGILNFSNIFDITKPNKLLLYLRLISCLIFNDKFFSNVKKLDENKISEWKTNLLITDGLSLVLDSVSKIINLLPQFKNHSNYESLETYLMILNILSKWLHFFTFSTAISISPTKETLSSIIKQTIFKRLQGVQIGVCSRSRDGNQLSGKENNLNFIGNGNTPNLNAPLTPGSMTPKSNNTPTFGSPHSSFSEDTKSKKIQKSFSIIGAEEYDTTFEEEVANSYYFKLICCNLHVDILKFIQFTSTQLNNNNINDSSNLNYSIYTEKDQVYLQILEILIILNEINPQALKDTLTYEYSDSIIINLLFVEKCKFVRKIVENLFVILLTQYKSLDQLSVQNIVNNIPALKNKTGVKSVKDILMLHILNNYKRIYSGQVYEEFFNLFGSLLIHISEASGKEKNMIHQGHQVQNEDLLGEEFNVNNLTMHILSIIFQLSNKFDSEMTEIELEQLSGNIYLFQCLCANHDQIVLSCLEQFSQENNINMVTFIYSNLFSIDITENVSLSSVRFKYSSKYLRQKAYTLLLNLMKVKESYKKELAELVSKHHTSFKNEEIMRMDLEIPLRGKEDAFIGLRNYGCTCYLNSLIQQLFMIPSFRENIYSVPILENKENKFPDLDKNPLYQLQLLFANLSYSLKQYHAPMHFIKSFNAFNNEPINVSIQQDCEEFLNILIDKLEAVSKELQLEHIFEDSIRCKISYETISIEKDYPYYKETDSSALSISLDIKNKRSIEEALDLFTKGEVLEGENKYYCEDHDKKISIIRRCSLKKLPKNVIINLKRFEFDYNTFEKVKLNDYCEFPMVIDFKPWMRASILTQNKDDPCFKNVVIDQEEINQLNDPEALKYKLTGILVHSGATAEGGHYFSYIYDPQSHKWHRYDDSKISEFNPADIKYECFGQDKHDKDHNAGTSDLFSKSQNAYLLFYTKIKENDSASIQAKVPENILSQIEQENKLFLKYKNYLDNDYFMFLKEFLEYSLLKRDNNNPIERLTKKEKSMSKQDRFNEEVCKIVLQDCWNKKLEIDNPSNYAVIQSIYLQAQDTVRKDFIELKYYKNKGNEQSNNSWKKKLIKMGIYFYFEIIVQGKDKHKTNSYANFIREMLEVDRTTCAWFLKKLINNKPLFIEFLLVNNYSEVREGVSRIIMNCIHLLSNDEQKYLNETFKVLYELDMGNDNKIFKIKEEYKACMMRFFKNNMLDHFDHLRNFPTKFNQFLQIIVECFRSQQFSLVNLSFKENLYIRAIFLLMNNHKGFETNYPTMGNKNIEPNFSLVIDMITYLILSCITEGIYKVNKYSPYSIYQNQNNDNIIQLPTNWKVLLQREVIIDRIISKYSDENIPKLLHHIAWGNLDVSYRLIADIILTLKE